MMFGQGFFDVSESLKQNVLISGANNSGKSRLACGLASTLFKMGFKVVVFDVSGIWKKISDLPFYTTAYKFKDQVAISRLPENTSGIYDLSLLKPSETKKVVNEIISEIWENQVSNPNAKTTFIIFEESEIFLRNIRGEVNESVFQIIHTGRNHRLRGILITTDLALLDPSAIRLCSQRFHGSLNVEENSRRKFRNYYGKDWSRVAFEALDSGDFIVLSKKKLRVVSVPLFKPTTQPQLHIETIETQPQQPQYTPNKWTRYVT